VQRQTIEHLEKSLAKGHPRALIQMATGSGKTFTAAAFCERLIRFAGAKRILFLVDRNTLGDQAFDEFQRYTSPLSVQQRLVDESQKSALRGASLRQAILKRAFEGKLVPQDPKDDPASELLARIRAARAGEGKARRRARVGNGGAV